MNNTTYKICPNVQLQNFEETELRVTENINVICNGNIKQITLDKLKNVLNNNQYNCNFSNETVNNTNIYLSLLKDFDNDKVNFNLDNEYKFEGYQLFVDGNDCANIYLVGNDQEGLYYAVLTLSQILEQTKDNKILKGSINDYPNILYRGFIEGFYGFPWTHNDRMDLMKFGSEYKMNTYIYAPKDDPYHRKYWRELYPEKEAKQIEELAKTGYDNNFTFMWTIHPGDTIDLDSKEDLQSAINKLEQLYGLGVRQFGVLFDDIGGIPNGKQQAEFINKIDDLFVKPKKDVRPLVTVGTRYCEAWGPSMTEYFKPFVETLHKDVEIMWTGAATMSNISREQMEAPKRIINSDKNLSVWWNYPVNDYCDAKILMGKVENLSTDIDNINAFFSNPMNQAQASKQALFCIADHNWNTKAYNAEESFKKSFVALDKDVAKELEIFASNSCYLLDDGGVSGDFFYDESWEIKDLLQQVKDGVVNNNDISDKLASLYDKFVEMENAALTIMNKCKNKTLVEELNPFLQAFELVAKSGQNALNAIKAFYDKDKLKVEHFNTESLRLLDLTEKCKVRRFKDGREQNFTVDVATYRIKPFIKDITSIVAVAVGIENAPLKLNYNRNNIALGSLGVTVETSSDANDKEIGQNVVSGKIVPGGKWCSTQLRPYLTVDLKQVRNIKQYRVVNCGHPDAKETQVWNTRDFQILASVDGENFSIVDEVYENVDNEVLRMLFNPVDARYVRLQILEPAQTSLNGDGHTRIYAFELFDEAYPEQSRKVLPSEIEINGDKVVISNVKKGDIIYLYNTLDEKDSFMKSSEVVEGQDKVEFEGVNIENNRLFVERVSRNYLPSVRTSKGI